MSRLLPRVVLLALLGLAPSPAHAQFGPMLGFQGSPYLNLARGGSAVINYYGIVRPQQEFRAFQNQAQNQFSRPMIQGPGVGGPSQFGRSSRGYFNNYLHYYR